MKKLILSLLLSAVINLINAQAYYTKNGYIAFYSKAPVENIKADNNQVLCILSAQSGQLQFSLLIKNFHFEKALMEEHFNENYLESDKFPKANFKGTIMDIKAINFTKDGEYMVNVSGDLILHGVTKKIYVPGSITIKSGKIYIQSKFIINLADYNIHISNAVKNNISPTPEISVSCNLDNIK
ncbi:MAG: YceI family protein [Chitinophagaceae bacterium]|nr:YceI family protein [Chitinophagaceae bacterium]